MSALSVTAQADAAALARMRSLLDGVAKSAPKRLAAETRRAALYICRSLRSRTLKAPRRARPREIAASVSAVPPKYVHSSSAGRRLLRRWTLARKLGTPDAYARDHYVYTDRHRGRGGRMVGGNAAAERRELLRLHGGIRRAGLARKSWGWVARGIYAAASMGDLSWRRGAGERRDPRRYVRGECAATASGAFARILNRLDYIRAALRPGAIAEAVGAAANRLAHNIRNHIERAAA